MSRLRFSGLLIIALTVGDVTSIRGVTYTFTGNFENGNFAPPNASFSITSLASSLPTRPSRQRKATSRAETILSNAPELAS
jgi:hypothetical protein